MSVIALVHIGSASVSGALVDGKKVIFTTEEECHFQEKLDSRMFLGDVAEALKQVLETLLKSKLGPSLSRAGSPSKVILFLSSPFVAGQLNILRQNSAKPFKITEQVIAELITQETSKFREDKKHVVIDTKIMGFRVNGYPTVAPHDQKANNLEVAHYLSISASEVIAKFRNVVKSVCHHDNTEFHSASFALFSVVRGLQPRDESLVLLDIGGETTEVTLVWRGVIRETLSFPLGHNALLRHLVKNKEHTPLIARSSLDLGLLGEKHLAEVRAEWLASFRDGLLKVIQHRFWSGEIVLLAEDQARGPLFTTWLESADLGKLLFNTKKPVIKALSYEALESLVDSEARTKLSLPLLVESVFMLK